MTLYEWQLAFDCRWMKNTVCCCYVEIKKREVEPSKRSSVDLWTRGQHINIPETRITTKKDVSWSFFFTFHVAALFPQVTNKMLEIYFKFLSLTRELNMEIVAQGSMRSLFRVLKWMHSVWNWKLGACSIYLLKRIQLKIFAQSSLRRNWRIITATTVPGAHFFTFLNVTRSMFTKEYSDFT